MSNTAPLTALYSLIPVLLIVIVILVLGVVIGARQRIKKTHILTTDTSGYIRPTPNASYGVVEKAGAR